jgi:hypothetical protein
MFFFQESGHHLLKSIVGQHNGTEDIPRFSGKYIYYIRHVQVFNLNFFLKETVQAYDFSMLFTCAYICVCGHPSVKQLNFIA